MSWRNAVFSLSPPACLPLLHTWEPHHRGWELKIRGIYECRCDERLHTKTKEFTHLAYTGLILELEHLKIETRLIDEKFANAIGEYVTERWWAPVRLRLICGFYLFIYYESIKREPKIKCIYWCRCDERLQTKTKVRQSLAQVLVANDWMRPYAASVWGLQPHTLAEVRQSLAQVFVANEFHSWRFGWSTDLAR